MKEAVFTKDSNRPYCPDCLMMLPIAIDKYGVEGDSLFFEVKCRQCDKSVQYFADTNLDVIKRIIVDTD